MGNTGNVGNTDNEKLDRRIAHLRAVVEDPPDAARPVAFMYRQAVAKRQAAEQKVRQAQAALQAAEAERLHALGAEGALHDAMLALVPEAVAVAESHGDNGRVG